MCFYNRDAYSVPLRVVLRVTPDRRRQMFSIKISGSHLEAIRETDRMLAKVDQYPPGAYSNLQHATVSGDIIGRVSGRTRRTLHVKGIVMKSREIVTVHAIIELVKENELWFPVKGGLLRGKDRYEFEYIDEKSFWKRSYGYVSLS